MISKIIFIVVLGVALAQEEEYSNVDFLKKLIDEERATVDRTSKNINNAPSEYDNMIQDRLESLNWEGVVEKRNLNKSITQAVIKGMFNNKQFNGFKCISEGVRETEDKLDTILNKIPEDTEKIKGKLLSDVMPYGKVMKGFEAYLEDLFKTKSAELNKAEKEDAKKKILDEVTKKMKLLNSILEQISSFVKDSKFKCFENFVSYVFSTEKSLGNTQREGAKKIMKCIS